MCCQTEKHSSMAHCQSMYAQLHGCESGMRFMSKNKKIEIGSCKPIKIAAIVTTNAEIPLYSNTFLFLKSEICQTSKGAKATETSMKIVTGMLVVL